MPESDSTPPPPSSDNPVLDAGPSDIEALLNQAEQLTQDAAAEVGAEPPPAVLEEMDLERPPIGSTALDDQLDEVSALIEQAKADAGPLTVESPPQEEPVVPPSEPRASACPVDVQPGAATEAIEAHDSPDSAADDLLLQVMDQAAAANPSASAVEAAVALAAETTPGAPPPSEQAAPPSEPRASARPAIAQPTPPAPPPKRAILGIVRSAISALVTTTVARPLAVLNGPFLRASDKSRQLAGLLGLLTLLSAAAIWLIPRFLRLK